MTRRDNDAAGDKPRSGAVVSDDIDKALAKLETYDDYGVVTMAREELDALVAVVHEASDLVRFTTIKYPRLEAALAALARRVNGGPVDGEPGVAAKVGTP